MDILKEAQTVNQELRNDANFNRVARRLAEDAQQLPAKDLYDLLDSVQKHQKDSDQLTLHVEPAQKVDGLPVISIIDVGDAAARRFNSGAENFNVPSDGYPRTINVTIGKDKFVPIPNEFESYQIVHQGVTINPELLSK